MQIQVLTADMDRYKAGLFTFLYNKYCPYLHYNRLDMAACMHYISDYESILVE